MYNRVLAFFHKRYFDKALPLEYRIYMIFFIACYIVSLFTAVSNLSFNLGLWGVLVQFFFTILCTISIFLPLRMQIKLAKPFLVFITHAYIPFLMFQTAGYDGTTVYFSLAGFCILAILFRGKKLVFLTAINILIYIAIFLLQYNYPYFFVAYDSPSNRLMDFIVSITAAATGMVAITAYISKAFEQSRSNTEELLEKQKESNRALARLSQRDALTGAFNRLHFRTLMRNTLSDSTVSGKSSCMLMLDLDHFKNINDTYGHILGDNVLIGFTRTVFQNIRVQDALVRIGGEEFIVIMPNTTLKEAIEQAEIIREAVSQTTFPNNINLTVSIGVIQSQPSDTKESMLKRVDTCLYKAKQGGRNLVIAENQIIRYHKSQDCGPYF